MNGISPWGAAASDVFKDKSLTSLYSVNNGNVNFKIHATTDSLWLLCEWAHGSAVTFRLAYSPDGSMAVKFFKERKAGLTAVIASSAGKYKVAIEWHATGFHFETKLTPALDLLIPFWPRDIVIPGNKTTGTVHARQVGARSGLIYFSLDRPKAGSVLYMQNLTALNAYAMQTHTTLGDTVGGNWPELGFALPSANQNPIMAGKEITISDAVVILSENRPDGEVGMVQQFLEMLAAAYMRLPIPATKYHNWRQALDRGLKDLIDSPGCWSQLDGHQYFNAYVSDYDTPPEIMVQLAVLLPLLDYVEWSGKTLDIMRKIKEGLPSFYNPELKTIMRWHPAGVDKLEGEEEQKKPMVMDSWYLHHPLLNLSRLALKGDMQAKELFLNSLPYATKVARHFKYEWPVFYHMETLEIIKAETKPGKGGEKDVPGLYTHVMLQAYDLTGEKKYLAEAKKAASKLKGLGFDLFYQANNTAFSAGALLRLYKLTQKNIYKELSYLCLANIFKNVQLWDCNYGFGKNYPTFFALYPLSDAPYTAVYEEQEVFCALHDYLKHAEGLEVLPSVSLLVAEYIRHLVFRAMYYYPPMLPKEMLKEKPKIGEVDPKLWVALEDLHDGWEQSGEVGQEVYGAGNAFGILPRHYLQVPDEDFMVYVDYPTSGFNARLNAPVSFKVLGDERLCCRLVLVKQHDKLPQFKVLANKQEVKGKRIKGGHLEFAINGNADIKISWMTLVNN